MRRLDAPPTAFVDSGVRRTSSRLGRIAGSLGRPPWTPTSRTPRSSSRRPSRSWGSTRPRLPRAVDRRAGGVDAEARQRLGAGHRDPPPGRGRDVPARGLAGRHRCRPTRRSTVPCSGACSSSTRRAWPTPPSASWATASSPSASAPPRGSARRRSSRRCSHLAAVADTFDDRLEKEFGATKA